MNRLLNFKNKIFTAGALMLSIGGMWAVGCNTPSHNKKSETSTAEISANRPNLIIMIADQWRGQALGFLNEDPVVTPTLDSLSKHSMVLKNFISNYPVCSPGRAMWMTGQYSFTNHVYANCNSATAPYNVELAQDAITWSDVLHKNGYSLGYIGKWHLDSPHPPYIPTYNNEVPKKWNEWTPPDRRHGFDYWYAYGTYDRHMRPMYWSTNAGRMDFHYVDEWEPQHNVDRAIEYLENKDGAFRKKDNPFGLVVSMNPPHTVYKDLPGHYYDAYKNIPLEKFLKDPDIPAAGTPMGDAYRRDIKYYYAAVTGDDQQMSRLLGTVRDLGLDDNTIILFISDHGNNLGKHYQISKNNFYEESLRVPFILYWKGHIVPGFDTTTLMSMPDVYPTLMELMGLKNQTPKQVSGKSVASYLLGNNGYKPEVQFFMGDIVPPDSTSGFRGVRTEQYKLAYQKEKKGKIGKYLFDYKNDPYELNNLYDNQPDIVSRLKKKLEEWLGREGDPFIKNIK